MATVTDPGQDARDVVRARIEQSGWPVSRAMIEWIVALVMFTVSLPVLVILGALVKLTSRGPALYTQTRLGRGGRRYRIYKLRTMRHNCERNSGPCWSTPGDPRITTIGRLLRRTHLDELPQLWNVLKGDMSLVGPRPERPELAEPLRRKIPFYDERLRVRPGVTGLAQVQLPPDTDLASVRRKLMCDLYYVRHASLWLDLQILVCTVCKVFGLSFEGPGRLLRVPTGEPVERVYHSLADASSEAILNLQGVG